MKYVVDLHGHSGYAGGVGNIELPDIARAMRLKGIHAYGLGDCLQPDWLARLEKILVQREPGLYALDDPEPELAAARFVWQTEIIATCAVASGGRKGTHVVILWPGPRAARAGAELLAGWEVKLGMGRPFLKCRDPDDVAEKFFALAALDPAVEFIPAHVLTPQGVYGSDHPVDWLADVFGDFAPRIHAVETGLSSDPEILALIPELDDRTLVSNSDAHSAALNRVGREFTCLELDAPSYENVIAAIRGRRVAYTAEFHPSEGRYYLTGHRAGLAGHPGDAHCYFAPGAAPANGLCPICGKPLTIGVMDRAYAVSRAETRAGGAPERALGGAAPKQTGRRLVPLVEALAAGFGGAGVGTRKVREAFNAILSETGTEAAFWELPPGEMLSGFAGRLPEPVLAGLAAVRRGDFRFDPPGYDGTYGKLAFGAAGD